MVEIIPIMLFILGWHPDRPGEIDLQRPERVFLSVTDCEEAGARMAAQMTEAAREQSGARYEYRCIEMPSDDEFDAAFEQFDRSSQ